MSALVLCSLIAACGQVDAAVQSTDAERADETVKLARAEALKYRIVRDGDERTVPQMREAPILKWSNPTEGALFGSVMLWTVDGRPETVASMYRWYDTKQEFHAEFKSLSLHPVKVSRDDDEAWKAEQSDIEFRPLTHDSVPDARALRRTQQMRDIARRFTARLVHPRKGSTNLRLLTQPVYRYEKTPENVLDGAMFAFVQGTDPEVFLLIEAEKSADGPLWRYALARMNMFELHVSLDDQEVWTANELAWTTVNSRRGSYVINVLPY